MRRTYSQGPLFTITYSDGSHHGTADSTWEMRRELRSAALAMMAELAAPEAVAEPVAAESAEMLSAEELGCIAALEAGPEPEPVAYVSLANGAYATVALPFPELESDPDALSPNNGVLPRQVQQQQACAGRARRGLDLEECAAPDDVAAVLRAAAERFFEAQGELQSAWQDKHAGRGWGIIAREFERLATKLEKTDLI